MVVTRVVFLIRPPVDVNVRHDAALEQQRQGQARIIAARQRGIDAIAETARDGVIVRPQISEVASQMVPLAEAGLGRRRLGPPGPRRDRGSEVGPPISPR